MNRNTCLLMLIYDSALNSADSRDSRPRPRVCDQVMCYIVALLPEKVTDCVTFYGM